MKQGIQLFSCIVLALGAIAADPAWSGAHEAAASPPPKTADLLRYTRLYTGEDNERLTSRT